MAVRPATKAGGHRCSVPLRVLLTAIAVGCVLILLPRAQSSRRAIDNPPPQAVAVIRDALTTPSGSRPKPTAREAPRRRGHAVVEPDELARRPLDHLRDRGGLLPAELELNRRRADAERRREAAALQVQAKFGNKWERAALRKADPDEVDEFEVMLARAPPEHRMRLRKQDFMPLDVHERDFILGELTAVSASVRVSAGDGGNATAWPRGTLCTFVPTDAHDEEHAAELRAALSVWGDGHTTLFTENPALTHYGDAAVPAAVHIALANLSEWRAGHYRRVLHRWLLRKRGSSKRQLRGRGELSLPMFHWMWRERDGLFRGCGWFMKADTDSFINRRQLGRQLLDLDADAAVYLGTAVGFDSAGYNYTQPSQRIQFNLGGPGYVFSRGLFAKIRMDDCFASMALDPIWLIHDDVGTGYCATRFVDDVAMVRHRVSFAASDVDAIEAFIESNGPHHPCYACSQAIHPVHPVRMEAIVGQMSVLDDKEQEGFCTHDACGVTLIHGFHPHVGTAWAVPLQLQERIPNWRLSHLALDESGQPATEAPPA